MDKGQQTGHRLAVPGRVLVAGAGALGSVFGGALRRLGQPVALLGRSGHLKAIAARGLKISGVFGEHTVGGFELADSVEALQGKFELILFCVKSYDTRGLADELRERLRPDGLVVSVQNGLGNLEALAERFGDARVAAARVIFGAEIAAPGSVNVTVAAAPTAFGPDLSQVGFERAAKIQSQLEPLTTSLTRAGVAAETVPDIVPLLWEKFIYNVALNPLGALMGMRYGELVADPDLRAIIDAIIEEAFSVAGALRVSLPFPDASRYRAHFYHDVLPLTGAHRPSMLVDLEQRGRTEIDALNGRLLTLAAKVGVNVPVNQLLVRLIKARERAGRGAIGAWRNHASGSG